MTFTEIWEIFYNGVLPALSPIVIACGFLSLICSLFSRQAIRFTLPVILAFGFLGGVTGYSVGASRVPVVGVVLPAMLTLCSGVLGYLFAKEQLKNWRLVIPFCIIALTFNSFMGLFVGSQMRGKYEEYDKKYQEWLLHYEKVELEVEKANELKNTKSPDDK